MNAPYYQDEHVTLYHGDCLELTGWLAADVLVTDPPYGMALRSGWNGELGDLEIQGDDSTDERDEAIRLWGTRAALAFGRWSVPRPAGVKAVLTWEKGDHTGMGDLNLPWKPTTEEIYVLGSWPQRLVGRNSSVLRHMAPPPAKSKGRWHPTEKPVSLMVALIDATQGVVADPFAGSGTTLVAAKQLGRRAIGVELEERYCEVIATRLSQGVLDFGGAA